MNNSTTITRIIITTTALTELDWDIQVPSFKESTFHIKALAEFHEDLFGAHGSDWIEPSEPETDLYIYKHRFAAMEWEAMVIDAFESANNVRLHGCALDFFRCAMWKKYDTTD